MVGVLALAAGAWVLISVVYLYCLRRCLEAKERTAVEGAAQVAAQAGRWRSAIEGTQDRYRRELTVGTERVLEALTGSGSLGDKARACQEVEFLLRQSRAAPDVPRAAVEVLSGELEESLRGFRREMAAHQALAREAAFARRGFPLSLFCGVIGLSADRVFE